MFLFSPKFFILSCISSWLSYVQMDTTTINIVGPTLLYPHWWWCAKGCNNSQQCWDLQCTMGRVQLLRLWRPWLCNACAWPQQSWESCTNRSSIVALHFRDHRTKMLGVSLLKSLTNFELCATTPNKMQQGVQMDATCNIQCSMLGVVGQQCCVCLYRALQCKLS